MPSTNQENPSPSASSIFLPLGRRTRRDSKASLSNGLDQDALNEALNTIHSAASQSNNLTVFNEYTDPPTAASNGDNRTLAGDIQGGISGLYNKLRASVGASKDVEDHLEPPATSSLAEDPSSSRASSGPPERTIFPSTHFPKRPFIVENVMKWRPSSVSKK